MMRQEFTVDELIEQAEREDRRAKHTGKVFPNGKGSFLVLPFFRMGSGNACGVVAVVRFWGSDPGERLRGDWAAYIGGFQPDFTYELAAHYLAEHGCKLTYQEAAAFMTIDGLGYRE